MSNNSDKSVTSDKPAEGHPEAGNSQSLMNVEVESMETSPTTSEDETNGSSQSLPIRMNNIKSEDSVFIHSRSWYEERRPSISSRMVNNNTVRLSNDSTGQAVVVESHQSTKHALASLSMRDSQAKRMKRISQISNKKNEDRTADEKLLWQFYQDSVAAKNKTVEQEHKVGLQQFYGSYRKKRPNRGRSAMDSSRLSNEEAQALLYNYLNFADQKKMNEMSTEDQPKQPHIKKIKFSSEEMLPYPNGPRHRTQSASSHSMKAELTTPAVSPSLSEPARYNKNYFGMSRFVDASSSEPSSAPSPVSETNPAKCVTDGTQLLLDQSKHTYMMQYVANPTVSNSRNGANAPAAVINDVRTSINVARTQRTVGPRQNGPRRAERRQMAVRQSVHQQGVINHPHCSRTSPVKRSQSIPPKLDEDLIASLRVDMAMDEDQEEKEPTLLPETRAVKRPRFNYRMALENGDNQSEATTLLPPPVPTLNSSNPYDEDGHFINHNYTESFPVNGQELTRSIFRFDMSLSQALAIAPVESSDGQLVETGVRSNMEANGVKQSGTSPLTVNQHIPGGIAIGPQNAPATTALVPEKKQAPKRKKPTKAEVAAAQGLPTDQIEKKRRAPPKKKPPEVEERAVEPMLQYPAPVLHAQPNPAYRPLPSIFNVLPPSNNSRNQYQSAQQPQQQQHNGFGTHGGPSAANAHQQPMEPSKERPMHNRSMASMLAPLGGAPPTGLNNSGFANGAGANGASAHNGAGTAGIGIAHGQANVLYNHNGGQTSGFDQNGTGGNGQHAHNGTGNFGYGNNGQTNSQFNQNGGNNFGYGQNGAGGNGQNFQTGAGNSGYGNNGQAISHFNQIGVNNLGHGQNGAGGASANAQHGAVNSGYRNIAQASTQINQSSGNNSGFGQSVAGGHPSNAHNGANNVNWSVNGQQYSGFEQANGGLVAQNGVNPSEWNYQMKKDSNKNFPKNAESGQQVVRNSQPAGNSNHCYQQQYQEQPQVHQQQPQQLHHQHNQPQQQQPQQQQQHHQRQNRPQQLQHQHQHQQQQPQQHPPSSNEKNDDQDDILIVGEKSSSGQYVEFKNSSRNRLQSAEYPPRSVESSQSQDSYGPNSQYSSSPLTPSSSNNGSIVNAMMFNINQFSQTSDHYQQQNAPTERMVTPVAAEREQNVHFVGQQSTGGLESNGSGNQLAVSLKNTSGTSMPKSANMEAPILSPLEDRVQQPAQHHRNGSSNHFVQNGLPGPSTLDIPTGAFLASKQHSSVLVDMLEKRCDVGGLSDRLGPMKKARTDKRKKANTANPSQQAKELIDEAPLVGTSQQFVTQYADDQHHARPDVSDAPDVNLAGDQQGAALPKNDLELAVPEERAEPPPTDASAREKQVMDTIDCVVAAMTSSATTAVNTQRGRKVSAEKATIHQQILDKHMEQQQLSAQQQIVHNQPRGIQQQLPQQEQLQQNGYNFNQPQQVLHVPNLFYVDHSSSAQRIGEHLSKQSASARGNLHHPYEAKIPMENKTRRKRKPKLKKQEEEPPILHEDQTDQREAYYQMVQQQPMQQQPVQQDVQLRMAQQQPMQQQHQQLQVGQDWQQQQQIQSEHQTQHQQVQQHRQSKHHGSAQQQLQKNVQARDGRRIPKNSKTSSTVATEDYTVSYEVVQPIPKQTQEAQQSAIHEHQTQNYHQTVKHYLQANDQHQLRQQHQKIQQPIPNQAPQLQFSFPRHPQTNDMHLHQVRHPLENPNTLMQQPLPNQAPQQQLQLSRHAQPNDMQQDQMRQPLENPNTLMQQPLPNQAPQQFQLQLSGSPLNHQSFHPSWMQPALQNQQQVQQETRQQIPIQIQRPPVHQQQQQAVPGNFVAPQKPQAEKQDIHTENVAIRYASPSVSVQPAKTVQQETTCAPNTAGTLISETQKQRTFDKDGNNPLLEALLSKRPASNHTRKDGSLATDHQEVHVAVSPAMAKQPPSQDLMKSRDSAAIVVPAQPSVSETRHDKITGISILPSGQQPAKQMELDDGPAMGKSVVPSKKETKVTKDSDGKVLSILDNYTREFNQQKRRPTVQNVINQSGNVQRFLSPTTAAVAAPKTIQPQKGFQLPMHLHPQTDGQLPRASQPAKIFQQAKPVQQQAAFQQSAAVQPQNHVYQPVRSQPSAPVQSAVQIQPPSQIQPPNLVQEPTQILPPVQQPKLVQVKPPNDVQSPKQSQTPTQAQPLIQIHVQPPKVTEKSTGTRSPIQIQPVIVPLIQPSVQVQQPIHHHVQAPRDVLSQKTLQPSNVNQLPQDSQPAENTGTPLQVGIQSEKQVVPPKRSRSARPQRPIQVQPTDHVEVREPEKVNPARASGATKRTRTPLNSQRSEAQDAQTLNVVESVVSKSEQKKPTKQTRSTLIQQTVDEVAAARPLMTEEEFKNYQGLVEKYGTVSNFYLALKEIMEEGEKYEHEIQLMDALIHPELEPVLHGRFRKRLDAYREGRTNDTTFPKRLREPAKNSQSARNPKLIEKDGRAPVSQNKTPIQNQSFEVNDLYQPLSVTTEMTSSSGSTSSSQFVTPVNYNSSYYKEKSSGQTPLMTPTGIGFNLQPNTSNNLALDSHLNQPQLSLSYNAPVTGNSEEVAIHNQEIADLLGEADDHHLFRPENKNLMLWNRNIKEEPDLDIDEHGNMFDSRPKPVLMQTKPRDILDGPMAIEEYATVSDDDEEDDTAPGSSQAPAEMIFASVQSSVIYEPVVRTDIMFERPSSAELINNLSLNRPLFDYDDDPFDILAEKVDTQDNLTAESSSPNLFDEEFMSNPFDNIY